MSAPSSAPPVPGAAARALLSSRPVFDAHVDSIGRTLDLGHDLGVRGPGHLDMVRGQEGGLGSVVLVCWVDPERFAADPFARARSMLSAIHELARRHPDRVRLVGNGADLAAARAGGGVAAIAGLEGGHPLEGDLARLDWLFARGLRVLTLVWNNHLPWVRSCRDGAGPEVPAGLSDFGRDVVARLNELGIAVDLSHAGERTFFDTLEVSTKPVIASHSGCRAVHDHVRNLTDDQLRRLAERDATAEERRIAATEEYLAIRDVTPESGSLARHAILQERAAPVPAQRVLDHVVHAVEVAGIDHVGLGSDFDGIMRTPRGLEDATCYGVLAEMLLQHGFTAKDAEKILGGNMERVFATVTGPGTAAHGALILPLEADSA